MAHPQPPTTASCISGQIVTASRDVGTSLCKPTDRYVYTMGNFCCRGVAARRVDNVPICRSGNRWHTVGSFACDSASGHMLFRVLWCDASNSRKHRSVSDSFYKNLFIFSLDNWDCGRLESTNRWNGCLFATLGPSVFLAWYCSVTPLHVTCKISALFSEKII